MVNEKETPPIPGLLAAITNPSQRPVSETDERVQKFEFLELFFYTPKKPP
jgi:hypothetical protein